MNPEDNSTRRTFLKTTGALGVGGMAGLAGCTGGGSDDGNSGGGNDGGGGNEDTTTESENTSTPEDRGDPAVREEYGLPELDYELEETLTVFQWTDYWPSGTVEIFEKAYGVDVSVSNYASNEEMFNKLKAGGSGQFDLVFPSDYMVSIMVEQDLLQPLDTGMIPHWDNLEPMWKNDAPYDPGEDRYSAPYFWGTSGVAWNSEMTPDLEGTPSWEIMWDDKYQGQITMLNDMRETIGAALKYLGYSLNTTDEAKIEEAKQLLIDQKPLLLTYSSVSRAAALQNQEASPLHCWSGDAFVAYWELYEDGSSPINYVVPQEGGVVWVDTAAITKEAKHTNAAHAFINFLTNAKMNAEIANYLYYPTPNEAAKEFVDDAALDNPAIYPPEEVFEKLEFIENVGQATSYYSEAWTEIKNA
ncbi:extracellular solute-binding protein [Haloferax sp. YSMS24]|uniref:extracellular solute-binding protein n=1 Tax=Haloferax sp. YSMS24 TaxID=3388425 RepID=UPI00398C8E32